MNDSKWISTKEIEVGMTLRFKGEEIKVASVELNENETATINGSIKITVLHAFHQIVPEAPAVKKNSYLDYILLRTAQIARETNEIEMKSTDPIVRQRAMDSWAKTIAPDKDR